MEKEQVAAFLEENLKTIFTYALSRVANREDAEDLAGEIVLAAWESAPGLRDERAFYGWFWSLAANTAKKFYGRRDRRRAEEWQDEFDETLADGEDFTEALVRAEETAALRRELALLAREYRECTVAYYIDGLPCRAVADKLGISLEMVKYYLFKTRKLLKEGIGMEREFGEKSYRPAPFAFCTVYKGSYDDIYESLFHRKLPGQILLSCYYTPMTVRELSIELGVAAVYLEDEIELLEKHEFLVKNAAGKYETALPIYTEAFRREFHRTAEGSTSEKMGAIIRSARDKLPAVREIGFSGADSGDTRLLWAFLFPLLLEGGKRFKERFAAASQDYVNFGMEPFEEGREFTAPTYAGCWTLGSRFYGTGANFGILRRENQCWGSEIGWDSEWQKFTAILSDQLDGKRPPEFVVLTEEQKARALGLFDKEADRVADLLEALVSTATGIMRAHAPKNQASKLDALLRESLPNLTLGLLAACAVKSGALPLPDFDGPAAMIVTVKEEEGKEEGGKK